MQAILGIKRMQECVKERHTVDRHTQTHTQIFLLGLGTTVMRLTLFNLQVIASNIEYEFLKCLRCESKFLEETLEQKWVFYARIRKQQQRPTQPAALDNGPAQIAELAKQVSGLNEKMNTIIAQIQMLRSELKK